MLCSRPELFGRLEHTGAPTEHGARRVLTCNSRYLWCDDNVTETLSSSGKRAWRTWCHLVSEKHLLKLKDEFERLPKYLEENQHVHDCVRVFVDALPPCLLAHRNNNSLPIATTIPTTMVNTAYMMKGIQTTWVWAHQVCVIRCVQNLHTYIFVFFYRILDSDYTRTTGDAWACSRTTDGPPM